MEGLNELGFLAVRHDYHSITHLSSSIPYVNAYLPSHDGLLYAFVVLGTAGHGDHHA
jgi:hypothetical protein